MKLQNVILLTLLTISLKCFSQTENNIYLVDKKINSKVYSIQNYEKNQIQFSIDSLLKRLDFTNSCKYKFQRQIRNGIGFQIIGATSLFYSKSDAINGIDKVYNKYQNDIALAGENPLKEAAAEVAFNEQRRKIEKRNDILNYSGYILIIGGGVIQYLGFKWLDKAYYVPTKGGFQTGIIIKI